MENSNFVFDSVIIKEESGFSSLCLNIDVASEGESIEEAKKNLKEAVTLYLETSIENNLPILRPIPNDDNPLIYRSKDIVEKFLLKADVNIFVYA